MLTIGKFVPWHGTIPGSHTRPERHRRLSKLKLRIKYFYTNYCQSPNAGKDASIFIDPLDQFEPE
jgi:hypothetical protein